MKRKKTSGKKASKRKSRKIPPRVNREWVVGEIVMPMHIIEQGGYSPVAVFVLEGPLVLSNTLHHPDDPIDWESEVTNAMNEPAVGAARRPSTIRVASEELQKTLQQTFPDIEIVQASTPEIDTVGKEYENYMIEVEPSFLQDGAIPVEVIAEFFSAAQLLYQLAPWKKLSDQDLMRIDIPEMGVEGAVLCLLGNADIDYGFALYPTFDHFEKFLDLAERMDDAQQNEHLETLFLSLTYEKAANLPPKMRREAARHGWEVASTEAYPVPLHVLDDLSHVAPSVDEIMFLTEITKNFLGFFLRFEPESEEPVSMTLETGDGPGVRFTHPFEAYEIFEE